MIFRLDPGAYTGTYELIAGDLSLDFANTLSWRYDERRFDWLGSYSNLAAWGLLVGVLQESEARALMDWAAWHPQDAAEVLARAARLREAIYQVFSSAGAGGKPGASPQGSELEVLNQELQVAFDHLRIAESGAASSAFAWEWDPDPGRLDRMLWPVARAAAELLTAPERLERVGECEGQGCGWLFIDLSKNRSRRWCSMEDCGNRAKARQHYRRRRKAGGPPGSPSPSQQP